jgi:hypothetical protein
MATENRGHVTGFLFRILEPQVFDIENGYCVQDIL